MNDVKRWIKHGRENAVSLKTLSTLTGMPEAAIEIEIERLRRTTAIINRGTGYYIIDSVDDAIAYINQSVYEACEAAT